MTMQFNLGPIVQARTPNGTIIQTKTWDANDVERRARGRTESSDVSRVWRNLRLY